MDENDGKPEGGTPSNDDTDANEQQTGEGTIATENTSEPAIDDSTLEPSTSNQTEPAAGDQTEEQEQVLLAESTQQPEPSPSKEEDPEKGKPTQEEKEPEPELASTVPTPSSPGSSSKSSKPSPAPAKITRPSTKAKKQASKSGKGKSPPGGQKIHEDKESLYDLEWQSETASTPTSKEGRKTKRPSSSSPKKGSDSSSSPTDDLGPLFAKRGNADLRQVDQSVNLMEFNGDCDSLDGSPTTSQVSASSRLSRGRKSLNAPLRPSKFTQRPSHVTLHMQEIDTSLLGVVEGGKGFRSERDKKYNEKPTVSDVQVEKNGSSRTVLHVVVVTLLKFLVVIAFVGFGIFVFLSFSEGSAAMALSEKTGFVEESKSGEMRDNSGPASSNTYDDTARQYSAEVHLSAHSLAHEEGVSADISDPLHMLEIVMLDNEVSLAENLDYNADPPSPQVKALMWLAHSDAYKIAEKHRDISIAKLIQRYALGVFYYAMGGHHQPLGPIDSSQTDRVIHILDSEEGKEELDYQGWKSNSNWMLETSVCFWYGISCNEQNLVETLNLTDNRLMGTLPMLELFQAFGETLKGFDVSHNKIRGSLTLPDLPSLSNSTDPKHWSQLEHFYVNDNEITGSAPFDWFGMSSESSLLGINMARNRLSGLPNSGIYNLGALEELYLSSNVLEGSLPRVSNMTKLQILHLHDNLFRGSIPREIFHLTSLVDFRAGDNSLTGTIPIDLSLLKALEVLSLELNGFSGHIPDHFHLMTNLKALDLSNNRLSGTIPLTLANVTKIEKISLAANHLTGSPVPTSFAALKKLQSFLIQHNDFYGTVPEAFCKLHVGFFHLHKLKDLQMDCIHEIVCDCCDECY